MYLLDTDVFIKAKNIHYPFDVCPGFWGWLDEAHGRSVVFSLAKVAEELAAGNDELATWARARKSLFLSEDEETVKRLRELSVVASMAAD